MHYEKKLKLANKRNQRIVYKSEAQKKSERKIRKIIKIILMKPSDYKMMITRKDWVASSKIRKSKFIDVIRSRPWKNTEALLSRVDFDPLFMPWSEYSKEIFLLYLKSFMHSRKYLKANNNHGHWLVTPNEYNDKNRNIKGVKLDEIIMNLEVSKIIYPENKLSFSSTDIILAPSIIRRMVAGEKQSLLKELDLIKKTLNPIFHDYKKGKKTGGLYSKIKKHEGGVVAEKLMLDLRLSLRTSHTQIRYRRLGVGQIEAILPMCTLCKEEYIRVHTLKKASVLIELEKNLSLYPFMKEIGALILFHFILSGASLAAISYLTRLEKDCGNTTLLIESLLKTIRVFARKKFKLNVRKNYQLVNFYNSFFSESVIAWDAQSSEIVSLEKRKPYQ